MKLAPLILLLGCLEAHSEPAARLYEGLLLVGQEYARFETNDGNVYVLRLASEEARTIYGEAWKTIGRNNVGCFNVAFDGILTEKEDFLERKIIEVQRIAKIDKVVCDDR